ncbi:MAG: hypothetical protein ACR2QO_08395, partial [Acidimicrobiales bacterium]
MKRKSWPFAATLFALLVVTAACGSSDETTAAGESPGSETTAAGDSDADRDDDMADDDHDMADGDHDMADGEHDHGEGIEVPDGMAVPTIAVTAQADSVSGTNLFIDLDEFTIAPEQASTEPVDGHGHLHLYIDGDRKARFYNTALHLTGLEPGEHEVMVEVSANNHSPYTVGGVPITAMTTIDVAEPGGHGHGDTELFESADPPAIDVTVSEDPKSGWNVFADVPGFSFAPEDVGSAAVDGEGHLHLYVDGEKITRLYGPWWHIAELEAGTHEIMIEVSANDHSVYDSGGAGLTATTTI